MLVSKVTVAVGAWVFCSLTRHARLSISTNLAINLNTRKRSDATTISKKEVFIPLSALRVRSDPLQLLEPDVTRDRSEGSKLTLIFVHTPYLGFWRSFRDRVFGLIASLAFPEPPRMAGIRSRAGSFCECRPVHDFHNWRG